MRKIFGSSASPDKVGLTIKGVGLGLIPVLIIALKIAGVSVLESDLVSLIESLSTAVASIMVIYGLLRKLWNGRWSA